MTTQITIFGSTGFIGKVLTEKALGNGYSVKTLARNPEKLGQLLTRVTCVKGDYFDSEYVKEALLGSDAVLSAIGPPLGWGRKKVVGKFPAAMASLVQEMENQNIKRIITIAGASVPIGDQDLPPKARLLRLVMNAIGGAISKDKDLEADVLSRSNRDWTILRPPGVKKNIKGQFRARATKLDSMLVNVDQLCEFMLDCIAGNDWTGKAPFVESR